MANDVGIKLKIEGEKEYKQSLKNIIASQKEWESEIKAVDSALESEMDAEEKSRRKGELLEKQIESQEKKLGLMKEQLEKVEAAYGKDSREAAQMRTNINNATTALNRMRGESQKLTPKLKTIGDTMQKAGKKMQAVGDKLNKYVAAPLGALAATSVAAFKEVDAGLDIVTKKTGATGQALIDLQESARNVATTIPTSFETAGSAIGEVNTKFGLVGEDLEDLSMKFVKFADLNDMDVSNAVDKTQKVMQAFGVESKDAGKLLDTMNKVGQNTGISMDTLSTTMVKNAAALRDMGMDAYDAAQFLGSVEMSGANTADVMKGMKKAMTEAAEDGMTLPEKLEQFNSVMQSGKSDAEKLTFAIETFGANAGQAIYNAYQDGSLNFASFAESAEEFAGNIDQTYSDVKGANDDLTTSFNKIKDAGSRIGAEVAKAIAPAVEDIADFAETVGKKFGEMDESQQSFVLAAVGAFALGGPVVNALGKTVEAAGKVAAKVGGLVGKLGEVSGASETLGGAASTLAGAGGPLFALTGTVAWAAFVVKSMINPVKTANEDVAKLVETQEENVKALDEAMESVNTAITTANEDIQAVNDQAAVALSIIDELEALESQSDRTAEEEARMKTLVDELNAMYPDLKVGIDKSTGSLSKSTTEIRKYVKAAQKMSLLEAYSRASSSAMDALVEANNQLYLAEKGKKEILQEIEDQRKLFADMVATNEETPYTYNQNELLAVTDGIDLLEASLEKSNKAVDEAKVAVAEATEVVEGYGEQYDAVSAELDEETEALEENTKATSTNTEAMKDNKKGLSEVAKRLSAKTAEALKQMKAERDEWDELYKATEDSVKGQIKLFDEWKTDSDVTFETMLANMKSQKAGIKGYTKNLEKLASEAAKSGDENLKAFVKYIADMGIEGAQYAEILVEKMETNKDDFNQIVRQFGYDTGWENNLAGILAYIENDFSNGAVTAAENFKGTLYGAVVEEREKVKTTVNGAVTSLFSGGKKMTEAITDGIEEGGKDAAEKAETVGAGTAGAVARGTRSKINEVETAVDSLTGEVDGISGNIDKSAKNIKTSANQSVLGLIGGMVLNKLLLASTATGISGTIGNISTVIDGKQAYLKKSGQKSVSSVADGMADSRKSDLEPEGEKVGKVVKTTVVTLDQMVEDFKSSGRAVVRGLMIGMDQEAVNAYAKAKAIADFIKFKINSALKIQSPSRVMMETGRYISEGLAIGMEQQLPEVEKASTMLSRAVVPFGATNSDVIQLRAEAFGGFDVDQIYAAVRSGAADGQQPVIISEKSFKRALVGMGVQVA